MSGIITYHCSNCGGPLKFDPELQTYACEYCLSEFSVEEVKDVSENQKESVLYSCPSCGAEIVTDETTVATFCYYCHNPVILTGRISGEYHPDYVIPFSIGRDKAVEIFKSWMKKKRLIPKAFYGEDQIEKISGVYFPYLLYSCKVKGNMTARADRVRIWSSGNFKYTETKTFDVKREGTMPVTFVPRNALKKASKELTEGVFPFHTDKMKEFSMGYLSGFMAERRDMEGKDMSDDIKEELRSFASNSLKSSISSYHSVTVQNESFEFTEERWQYALLPVWTLTYFDRGKDEMYYFTVNGQTGKVCGKLPVDKGKLLLLFSGIFFPVMIAMILAGYLI